MTILFTGRGMPRTAILVAALASLVACVAPAESEPAASIPAHSGTAAEAVAEAAGAERPWWQQPTAPAEPDVPRADTSFSFSGDVLFDVGSSTLSMAASTQLAAVVAAARERPGAIVTVAGHTDGDGSETDNLVLSRARADTTRRWLIDHGLRADQVVAIGYGESRPVATNDTAEGKARNRRCDITVTAGPAPS
ncbi:OmpA family protein [Jiangella mangrovi]|uniref:Outer membrane protein OmpA-like peptidoglycan-associated protein n=1 Tax=Jiangella mangrovi TaxID=1524084 RepID=A0A7W9GW38_9ACTN|nr:OmpA family protein [Jiangella mangrovi]MBB5790831.1 outer membrane protein OmpA-like peptidoglycan-associated protein [Jiangella mangrovi]